MAHFLIRAQGGAPITIYGDGAQVRDILYIDDLVEAFLAAEARVDALAGRVFNIGGGPGNAFSLLELLDEMERLIGRRVRVTFEGWRPGDQRHYASDFRAFQAAVGWRPKVSPREGIRRLNEWLTEARPERMVHA